MFISVVHFFLLLCSEYFAPKHTHTMVSMNLHFLSLNGSYILDIFLALSAIANYYFAYWKFRGDMSSSKICTHSDEGLVSLLHQTLGYQINIRMPFWVDNLIPQDGQCMIKHKKDSVNNVTAMIMSYLLPYNLVVLSWGCSIEPDMV